MVGPNPPKPGGYPPMVGPEPNPPDMPKGDAATMAMRFDGHVHCIHSVDTAHIRIYQCCRCKGEWDNGGPLPHHSKHADHDVTHTPKE